MASNDILEQLKDFDINDIDWDRIGVWPAPVKVLVAIAAMVLIIFAGYFFIIKDKNTVLEQEVSKETDLRKSFEAKAFEAANLDKYRKQMEEMERSFGALVSRLPSKTEVPGLLDDIDDKGVESRLEINSLALQDEVSTEFHVELPIRIIVTGGYHEFGTFVSGIAGMPRIVTLHDFKINRLGKQGKGQLKMEIIAKTYRYKSQEG